MNRDDGTMSHRFLCHPQTGFPKSIHLASGTNHWSPPTSIILEIALCPLFLRRRPIVPSHFHNDLAELLIALHVSMRIHYLIQREDLPIEDGIERSGLQSFVNVALPAL